MLFAVCRTLCLLLHLLCGIRLLLFCDCEELTSCPRTMGKVRAYFSLLCSLRETALMNFLFLFLKAIASRLLKPLLVFRFLALGFAHSVFADRSRDSPAPPPGGSAPSVRCLLSAMLPLQCVCCLCPKLSPSKTDFCSWRRQ